MGRGRPTSRPAAMRRQTRGHLSVNGPPADMVVVSSEDRHLRRGCGALPAVRAIVGSRSWRGAGMVLAALVAMAGAALVQAIVTDGWEGVRHRVARLFGRGKPDPAIERR